MADSTINGRPAISGLTVSFLGGFPAMAQIFGQFAGGPLSNRIGRKWVMPSRPIASAFSVGVD